MSNSTAFWQPDLFSGKSTIEGAKKSREVNIGDFVLSNSMSYGRPYIVNIHGYIHDGWLLLSNFDNRLIKEYLYYILSSDTVQKQFNNLATGITVDNLNVERVSSVKIPLPPLDVQEQIVRECEAMDEEVAQAQQAIEQAEQEIEKAIIDIAQKGYPNKKTEDFAEINPSKTEIRQIDDETMVSFVEMASVSDEGYIAKKEDKPLKEVRASSYTYFREDDIIIAKITPSMENGKCAIAEGLTNNLGMGSSEFHVIRADKAIALPEYVFAFLNRESVRQEAATKMTGASGHRRVPASFYEQFVIPLPQDIKVQEDLITKIKNQKTAITQSKQIIEGSAERKQAILKKYL
ncbi:MAG: restriction endonuclease subunit S [Ardenticatenaceae bacterium]|nr:restriction endonuclease subunit S [Ardenticatenaceae bacterium]